MMRLFIGLALPDDLATQLADLQGSPIRATWPGARWVERRNLHLTLRFIGEVDEVTAGDIHDALALMAVPPLDLTVDGLGWFGQSRPTILWAGVDRNPVLMQLQAHIDRSMDRAGLPRDRRKFTPHITLAHMRDTPLPVVQHFIAAHSPLRLTPVMVDGVTLFRSHLGRHGAEYEALALYPSAFDLNSIQNF